MIKPRVLMYVGKHLLNHVPSPLGSRTGAINMSGRKMSLSLGAQLWRR